MKRNQYPAGKYPDVTNVFAPRADNARRKRQEKIASTIAWGLCGSVVLWKVFELLLNGGRG